MDEEDDDFYDPTDVVPPSQAPNEQQNPPSNPQETGDEEEEEIEVEDDEDEFNIITEAPPDAPPVEIPHPRHAMLRNESQRPSSTDSPTGVSKSATPLATPKVESATPVPSNARPAAPQKPGSAYPGIHTSTVDVDANPTLPMTGKPILSTDMDNDFPADDKPWRRPGSDISDYFNYGFDEFTWASYVLKQHDVRQEVGGQRKQLDDMQTFMSMGLPPMPGAPPPPGPPAGAAPPPGMPPMPGMPDMSPEIMQGMLTGMMTQGLDPSAMDPMSFMQHAQAMMGQPGSGGGQPQGQGYGQGGGQQMGYGGYDQRGGYGGGRGRGRRW